MKQIGRYQILSQLGSGGMALVYRAYDPRFKREVAIKVMAAHFLHNPQFRQRFEREAQVVASLAHPAIVPVYDFGEENGQPYLVMRLMSGGSLAERLQNGVMSLNQVAWLLSRLAPALDMAHQKGIVHRDLKPDNILFDQQGNPYMADFGIAKLLAQTTMGLSHTGMIIGTPFYMSPEQARGDKGIDGRCDIYSLGAISFELLTGQRPYDADTPAGFIYKHIHEPVPKILAKRPDLPPSCEVVIGRAMAKNRDARYATAGQLAAALKAIVDNQVAAQTVMTARKPVTPHQTVASKVIPAPNAPLGTYRQPPLPPTIPARRWWQQWAVLASTAALLIIVTMSVTLTIAGRGETGTNTQGAVVVAPTSTNTPTYTPVSLTSTPTAIDTLVPPTSTPTATDMSVPPTLTPTPTNTPVPPTSTPTPTNTLVPLTSTNTPTNTPDAQATLQAAQATANGQATQEAQVAANAQATQEAQVAANGQATQEAQVAANAQATQQAQEAQVAVNGQATQEAQVAANAQATQEAQAAANAQATQQAQVAANAQASQEAQVAANAQATQQAQAAANAQATQEAQAAANAQATQQAQAAANAQATQQAQAAANAQATQEAQTSSSLELDGEWRGTTSQGKGVYIEVENGFLMEISISFYVCESQYESSLVYSGPSNKINNNQINYSSNNSKNGDVIMTGTFQSDTTASGVFELKNSKCSSNLNGTWNATKE